MKALVAVFAALVIGVLGFFGCAYGKRNQIIDLDNQAQAKWGDIDTTLQRRLDLIPNLVNTVKGAGKYEGETLVKITEARNNLDKVVRELKDTPRDPQQAERLDRLNTDLLGSIRGFMGIAAEAYPQLKATDAYRDLMAQLEGTENRIAVARRDYNSAAASFNAMIAKWGWMPFCGGRQAKPLYKASAEAQKAPEVNF